MHLPSRFTKSLFQLCNFFQSVDSPTKNFYPRQPAHPFTSLFLKIVKNICDTTNSLLFLFEVLTYTSQQCSLLTCRTHTHQEIGFLNDTSFKFLCYFAIYSRYLAKSSVNSRWSLQKSTEIDLWIHFMAHKGDYNSQFSILMSPSSIQNSDSGRLNDANCTKNVKF